MANNIDRDLEIAKLSGFLEAFALLNSAPNQGYDFSVEFLEIGSTMTIRKTFELRLGNSVPSLTEFPLPNWKQCLRKAFKVWLFGFARQGGLPFNAPTQAHRIRERWARAEFYNQMIEMLVELSGEVSKVCEIRIGLEHYACGWQHFAIKGSAGTLLLHFVVSD